MKFVSLIFSALLLVTLFTFSKVSVAGTFAGKNNQQQKLAIVSSKHAAQKVQRRFGGKILKVQRKSYQGKSGYKVKLIKSNGNVISIWVDAKTGRLAKL